MQSICIYMNFELINEMRQTAGARRQISTYKQNHKLWYFSSLPLPSPVNPLFVIPSSQSHSHVFIYRFHRNTVTFSIQCGNSGSRTTHHIHFVHVLRYLYQNMSVYLCVTLGTWFYAFECQSRILDGHVPLLHSMVRRQTSEYVHMSSVVLIDPFAFSSNSTNRN